MDTNRLKWPASLGQRAPHSKTSLPRRTNVKDANPRCVDDETAGQAQARLFSNPNLAAFEDASGLGWPLSQSGPDHDLQEITSTKNEVCTLFIQCAGTLAVYLVPVGW